MAAAQDLLRQEDVARILDVLAALGLAHKEEDRYGRSSYLHEWGHLLPIRRTELLHPLLRFRVLLGEDSANKLEIVR